MKNLWFIKILFASYGCDSAKVRRQGICLSSSNYGGPYEVVESGLNIKVRNPVTDEERFFPNDQNWKQVDCYR